jgi:hypothetical protein
MALSAARRRSLASLPCSGYRRRPADVLDHEQGIGIPQEELPDGQVGHVDPDAAFEEAAPHGIGLGGVDPADALLGGDQGTG